MKNPLEFLESTIRSLIEDRLINLIPGISTEDKLIISIASLLNNQNGTSVEADSAPNTYLLIAHPGTLAVLNDQKDLLSSISNAIESAGKEAGLQLKTKPQCTTLADSTMSTNEIKVIASHSTDLIDETNGMTPVDLPITDFSDIPHNAFLILHGSEIFPLDKHVLNIGRRLDNHIVIDDPRISRAHAQIRAIRGNYVIFDLNSTGGTFVNNDRKTQSILYPGDVISLAGVSMIYGQDLPPAQAKDDPTQPDKSISSDRPTISLPRDNDLP